MKRTHPTRYELLEQNKELQAKLREAEETLEAIRAGAVDALVVDGQGGQQTFTLDGSDHAYRVLVESMKEGAVTVAADGTVFYCNARFGEMVRRPNQDIVGKDVHQFILPAEREVFAQMFKRGLEGGARGEVGLVTAHEAVVPAYLSINSLSIYDVPAVCMVVTDLTEQRRSEEILAAEKLARSILNQAAEAIVVADENGRIIRASQTAEEMCGESLSLKSFNDVFHLHNMSGHEIRFAARPEDKERLGVQSDLLKLAMSGTISQGIEVTLDREDGERRNLLLSAGPVLSAQSGVVGCTVTLTDISKLKRVERELKKAKEEADSANRAKTTFLANMSHEIRTPLGAVLGFAELLAEGNLSPAQREDFIAKIKRNGAQLSSLIDDILDLSKVESGRLQIESMDVSVKELLRDVISVLKYRVMEKTIAVHVASRGPIPRVIASDPVRLKQILSNVVGNAIKFTDQGLVSLLVERRGEKLVFSVEDTGCGLSEAQSTNLFHPFRQADGSTTRKYGGTGLGLALSRGLAQALGGDLTLERAAPNEGCLFVASVAPDRMTGEWEIKSLLDLDGPDGDAPAPAVDTARLDGLRVLLAEDAPDNQYLISRFLKIAGADIELADNGHEAVEMALANPFDVVLMDVQMPVVDGLEATLKLRTAGYKRPIIALTAHAMKEERDRCFRVGCDEHLTKPVNRQLLVKTIRRLARGRIDGKSDEATLNLWR